MKSIQYTDPESVGKIMDMIGTKGVMNSPEGLYINRGGLLLFILKGEWVCYEDGLIFMSKEQP